MGLLVNLVEDVTAAVHGRVCASFFSEHRLLFTAMFSMQLQLYNGSAVFSAAEMHFFLYGTVPKHAVPVPTRRASNMERRPSVVARGGVKTVIDTTDEVARQVRSLTSD